MHTATYGGQPFTPGKIVCIGRNYVAHIEELGNEIPGEMVVFNKPATAIGSTLYAGLGEPLHYEGEIALRVEGGRFTGVGFGLDLTKRALQTSLKAQGLPWERAKAFDGAALFSDFVPLPTDITSLSLRLLVDGALRQQGGVELMLYPPATILDELGKFTTLQDGDIVMTGTPAGVGEVNSGEHFLGQVLARENILAQAEWTAC